MEIGVEHRRCPDQEAKPSAQRAQRTHRTYDMTDQWRVKALGERISAEKNSSARANLGGHFPMCFSYHGFLCMCGLASVCPSVSPVEFGDGFRIENKNWFR